MIRLKFIQCNLSIKAPISFFIICEIKRIPRYNRAVFSNKNVWWNILRTLICCKNFEICSPCISSMVLPLIIPALGGKMATSYSPLSLTVKFLSSSDPLDLKRVILPSYCCAVVFESFLEVIRLSKPKVQATTTDASCGVSNVVNITFPPTAACRTSSSNTPAPSDEPGGDN